MTSTPVRRGTVVVGIDGSAPGAQALTWAAGQAAAEGRALTIVHGLGVGGSPWIDAYGFDSGALQEATASAGTRLLDDARTRVEQEFADLEVEVLMVSLDPRTALLDAAEGAAMLVVGSRGRGPVARLVLGSVSSAVSRHAPCPTAVVRPCTPGSRPRGVLVGVDPDGRSQQAVELAFRLAAGRGLPLTVMHCALDLTGPAAGPPELPYDAPGHEASRLVLDESVAGLREEFTDVEVSLVIGRGLVEDSLVRASSRMDVVVVGRHHVDLFATLLDLHTDRRLVSEAATVVVVVPEPSR